MFNDEGLVRIKIESGINKRIDSIENIEVQIPGSDSFVALHDVCEFIMIQGLSLLFL